MSPVSTRATCVLLSFITVGPVLSLGTNTEILLMALGGKCQTSLCNSCRISAYCWAQGGPGALQWELVPAFHNKQYHHWVLDRPPVRLNCQGKKGFFMYQTTHGIVFLLEEGDLGVVANIDWCC